MKPEAEAILEKFKKYQDTFINQHGPPIVFGRLEGLQDAVEILAKFDPSWNETLEASYKLSHERHEEMAKYTSSE